MNRKPIGTIFTKAWWTNKKRVAFIGSLFSILGGAVTAIYLTCSFINRTEAYGPAINTLQGQIFTQHDTLISIQQEVHDIHEWLKLMRHP